jgi:hypothetical protein
MPQPRVHAAVSIGLAALVVARSRRWRDAIPVLLAGVLVDIDHMLDYFANRSAEKPTWVVLPLHAWEWVFALAARRRRASDALAVGLAAHLALDQTNWAITHPLFYWISFRVLNGFRARTPLIQPERYERGSRWMKQHPLEWL